MKTELQVEDVHMETPVQGPQAWQQILMKTTVKLPLFEDLPKNRAQKDLN